MKFWLAAALALLLPAGAAQAQWFGQRTTGQGNFDFYVLALSWSPGWCETTGDRKGSAQCEAGTGTGFVLHGLWPQYTRGYPSDCASAERSPSRMAMEAARGVYPDPGLARYEWRKHGTCSGLDPLHYFRAAAAARDSIAIPPVFRTMGQEQSVSPLEIERAFIAANRGLRPGMMAVACSRGLLQEVRLCLSKDLRSFVSCGDVDRKSCRAARITVPPPR